MTGRLRESDLILPLDRVIPWTQGEIPLRGIEPGKVAVTSGGAPVGLHAGRWTLAPIGNLPFLQIRMAKAGNRTLTWGQSVEIPEGETGQVANASYHKGDATLIGQGYGWGWSGNVRPPRITVVQKWYPSDNLASFVTEWVDTRMVRRAYLVQSNLTSDFTYTIRQEQPTGADQVSNASSARSITWQQAVVGYRAYIPLGFGSGEQREPAPGINTVPELRPMALLDRARVEVTFGQSANSSISSTTDAFFILEY